MIYKYYCRKLDSIIEIHMLYKYIYLYVEIENIRDIWVNKLIVSSKYNWRQILANLVE